MTATQNVATQSSGYTSPLMARIRGEGELSYETLATYVPIYQAGLAAAEALAADTTLSAKERASLADQVADGTAAKETLFLAAIPLIKALVKKEHERRKKWSSNVTMDDLFQEACGGFIRGLKPYKVVDSARRSSVTNYLAQWITVEMRRNTETLDNDFGVAYEVAELARKVRALRSRLTAELNREPTDDEIIIASTDPLHRGGRHMGRTNRAPTGKPLTQAQLDTERAYRAKIGHTRRYTAESGADSEEPGHLTESMVSQASVITATPASNDTAETVTDQAAQTALSGIITSTLAKLGVPDLQRDIIARKWALAPYKNEATLTAIAAAHGITAATAGAVIEAFNQEMAQPGGAFHSVTATLAPEELADIGLGWVRSVLGPYPPSLSAPATAPAVLTSDLPRRKKHPPPTAAPTTSSRDAHVKGQFRCDYHDWAFTGIYRTRGEVPDQRDCPRCGRPSLAIRILEVE